MRTVITSPQAGRVPLRGHRDTVIDVTLRWPAHGGPARVLGQERQTLCSGPGPNVSWSNSSYVLDSGMLGSCRH